MKKKMKRFDGGGYTGDDEIVKYRMGMIDAKGNDLTKPTSRDFDTTDSETPSMDLPALKEPKSVERTVVKTKVEPASKKNKVNRDFDTTDSEKKPYIDIPKNTAIGMRQFRSDGVSPMERLLKSITGTKSQRTTAAEKGMKKGGSVSSASKRADGIAQRGKTKGKMC
jgi:hypothetical protein